MAATKDPSDGVGRFKTPSASYLAGTGTFPERAAVLAVVGTFHTSFADMVANWADWATSVIADWPDEDERWKPGLVDRTGIVASANQALADTFRLRRRH